MRPKQEGKAGAAEPHRVTPVLASLNLIHRNNCSNLASMRVTARFDLPEGVDLATVQNTLNFAFGPLAQLMMGRRLDGR